MPISERLPSSALFGSSLNEHVHFQCCVFDGVLGPAAFADAQACVRPRTLVDFVRRGLIDKDDATVMRAWAGDGHFHLPRRRVGVGAMRLSDTKQLFAASRKMNDR